MHPTKTDWIRKTVVAKVDVDPGGYQWAHTPQVIGWRVELGPSITGGCATHNDYGLEFVRGEFTQKKKALAIARAKRAADKALAKLIEKHC